MALRPIQLASSLVRAVDYDAFPRRQQPNHKPLLPPTTNYRLHHFASYSTTRRRRLRLELRWSSSSSSSSSSNLHPLHHCDRVTTTINSSWVSCGRWRSGCAELRLLNCDYHLTFSLLLDLTTFRIQIICYSSQGSGHHCHTREFTTVGGDYGGSQ